MPIGIDRLCALWSWVAEEVLVALMCPESHFTNINLVNLLPVAATHLQGGRGTYGLLKEFSDVPPAMRGLWLPCHWPTSPPSGGTGFPCSWSSAGFRGPS